VMGLINPAMATAVDHSLGLRVKKAPFAWAPDGQLQDRGMKTKVLRVFKEAFKINVA